MKLFAWILLFIAVVGSAAVGTSWARARRGERKAATDAQKAEANLSDTKFGEELNYQAAQTDVEADEQAVENDNLEVQIADEQGYGLAKALEIRELDEARLRASRLSLEMKDDVRALGPSYDVQMAQERLQACLQSVQVYQGVSARDEKLAYALGVVWLAFGFAVSLASRSNAAPIPEPAP